MIINNIKYKIIENYKNGFDEKVLREKMTDYFIDFDYVVGDWSYGSLRLKGFCKNNNKIFNKINDYQFKDNYLKDFCSTECRYFIIEKEDGGE